jgi:hypothetical protein
MSNSSKIVTGVVVLIVLILIGWWYAGSASAPVQENTPVATANVQVAAADVPVAGLTTSSKDASDAALDKDLANVSTQIDGLTSDSAALNQ